MAPAMRHLVLMAALLATQRCWLPGAAAARSEQSAPRVPLTAESITSAVDTFMDAVDRAYDLRGIMNVPHELQSQLASLMKGASAAAAAAATDAPDGASAPTGLPGAHSSGEVVDKDISALRSLGGAVRSFMRGLVTSAAGADADDASAPGRRLLDADGEGAAAASAAGAAAGEEDEDAEVLAAIRDVLLQAAAQAERMAGLTTLETRRMAGVHTDAPAASAAAGNATQRRRRRLQQDGGDDGGLITDYDYDLDPPVGPYAFQLIFSNLFDFFRRNGLFFFVPILGDLIGNAASNPFFYDLPGLAVTPFDNAVNTLFFTPLPQSNDDLEALIRRYLGDYCSEEEASNGGDLVLGEFSTGGYSVVLDPWSCPIRRRNDTGVRYIDVENCDPATLTISVDPFTVTEPYVTGASYVGAECAYTFSFGTDTSVTLGGGSVTNTFRRSTRGVDIQPTVIDVSLDSNVFTFIDFLGALTDDGDDS